MRRILILDDDASTLDVLKEALQMENFEIQTCNDLSQFPRMMSEYQPHLLLVDYLLEGGNGGDVCSHLKRDPHTEKIPVIIMSAYARVFESVGDYGCDAFVAKPFSLAELVGKIREHLYMASDR